MSALSRRFGAAAALALLALFALRCGEDEGIPTGSLARPDKLKKVSGDQQVGRPGSRLAQPFTVQVLDSDNNPVPSHTVKFEVTSNGGAFAGNGEKTQEVVTNSSGYTSAYLTLSTDSIYTVNASAVGISGSPLQGSPATFRALASASAAVPTGGGTTPDDTTRAAGIISIVTSPGQDTIGFTGKALATPRIVKVTDIAGFPIKDVPVYWSVLEGGGSLPGNLTFTDANGLAFAPWTLGPNPGINRLQAYFIGTDGSINKVVFTVRSLQNPDVVGPAYTMVGVDLGADTLGSVGRIFPSPLAVQVRDSLGHGIGGVEVFYSAFQGGGAFDLDTKTTDTYGVAANAVRLGNTPALNIVQASATLPDGSLAIVQWRIWSHLDPDVRQNAWDIAIVSSPDTPDSLVASAGELYPLPLVVSVTDTFGRGSPGQTVTFLNEAGGGQLQSSSAITNSDGIAQTALILGPTPGLNRVRAIIVRSTGEVRSVTFDIWGSSSGAAAGPGSMAIISGDEQTGEVNTILPLPLVVAVYDTDGRALSGVSVTFTVSQGFGSIGKEGTDPSSSTTLTLITDAQGLAVITYMLGPGPDLDNSVVAEVRRPDGATLSVTLHAQAFPKPDTANRLIVTSGTNQGYDGSIAVASLLPLPVVFRVVDTTRAGIDNDFAGAPVSNFSVLVTAFGPGGGGSITDNSGQPAGTGRLNALTDADGLAAVRWTLGTLTGGADLLSILRHNYFLVAVAVFADGTQDSVIVFATAVRQAAATIAALGSTDLTATAGKSLSGLGVFVADQFGNEAGGVSVSYSVSQSPGSYTIASPSQTTSTSGVASVTINQVSTKVGEMIVDASNGTLGGSPVSFTITVTADVASKMRQTDGTGQSVKAGTAFPKPVQVKIYDQYDNPVSGVFVTFTVTAGTASTSPNQIATDDEGVAEATVTPTAAGAITVTATATIGGAATTITFNLTATP